MTLIELRQTAIALALSGAAGCAAACSEVSPEDGSGPEITENPGRDAGYPDVGSGGSGGSGSGGSGSGGMSSADGVGDPCLPNSELSADYAGAVLSELQFDAAAECGSNLCLANHFQGRVSCPFGQNEEDLSLSPDDAARCQVPGSDPVEGVAVAVAPQFTERPSADAVYCTCRCATPEGPGECECPDGMECVELIEPTGIDNPYVGSYCIKPGTAYDPSASYGAPCGVAEPTRPESCQPYPP